MVALLRHQPATGRPRPVECDRRSNPSPDHVVGGRAGVGSVSRPPALRLVAGGRSVPQAPAVAPAERPRLELIPGVEGASWPPVAVVMAAALMVFGLLGLVRVVQGAPDPAVGAGRVQAVAPTAVPGAGDRVIVAGPGDSLWSIAVSIAPDGDPRPVVAALIEVNGGETVRIGQQIVIPARLVD